VGQARLVKIKNRPASRFRYSLPVDLANLMISKRPD
jgi:hypothetical protein